MKLKAQMRKIVSITPYAGPCVGDVKLLTLECGHEVRFTQRNYNSRTIRPIPSKKKCSQCQVIADSIVKQIATGA